MPDSTDPPSPTLASGPVLGIVVGLLLAALVLEILLSPHWTDPFREPGTWVLIGVGVGFALRGLGRLLTRWGRAGEAPLRQLSLGVWLMTALGGLASLLL